MKMVSIEELILFISVVMDIISDFVEIVTEEADKFSITIGVIPKEESKGEGRGRFNGNSVMGGKMEFKARSSDAN